MVKLSDIVLEFFIAIVCLVAAIVIMETSYPFLFFLPVLVYFVLHILLKRNKKISAYVRTDFQKLGYTILNERPTNSSELDLEIRPAILISDVPLSRYGYIRQFERVFEVQTTALEKYSIQALVTKHWNGSHSIRIKKKKKMR